MTFLGIFALVACFSFVSCEEKVTVVNHYYSVGIKSMAVTGGTSYISVLATAQAKFDSHFVLDGNKADTDKQARATFDADMVIIQDAADTITDCTGTVTYSLNDIDREMATYTITLTKK